MLLAGVMIGPVTGILDPARDIGLLVAPMVSIAVAIILFEGGLTLNLHHLRDAAVGVKRLMVIGAPLGWISLALALHFGAGLGWETSAAFGGIMVVTGPTVIAPLLRQAKLARRPAALLQWEAIVNDPIGALAAVLAFELVVVFNGAETLGPAALWFLIGISFAAVLGLAAGKGLAMAFRRGLVPEYMKVPVLFVVLIGVFAASDAVLHESGLLAVTVMVSLLGTGLPWRETLLIALTGPRGVVLVAVAGLFGDRLAQLGIADGAVVAPLAFTLVAVTVVVNGFTLKPLAAGSDRPGLLLVGGSNWSAAFAETLRKAGIPVLLADPNRARLRKARQAGIATYYGNVLSAAAEHSIELPQYGTLIALSDNDDYNTLVTTDLAPKYGRDAVFQITQVEDSHARHALPNTVGGRPFAAGKTYDELQALHREGWEIRLIGLSSEYPLEQWRKDRAEALLLVELPAKSPVRLPKADAEVKAAIGTRLLHFSPPKIKIPTPG